jgi:hypothetical protein
MDASSGQLAVIDNLPAEALMDSGSGAVTTVNQLFNQAATVVRLGIDPHEVKYRPTDTSNLFKTEREAPLFAGVPAASATTVSTEALRFGSRFIGFAWKNVGSTSDLMFEWYQNIEWRPNNTSGFVAQVPRQLSTPGYFETVLKYLDDNHPGWQIAAKQVGMSTAQYLVKAAMTGVANRGMRTIRY